MDDCSLYLMELLFVSNCTTSCVNTGILSQVNGVPWLPFALLESLPLPREPVDMPRVGQCFALLVSFPPSCDCVVWPLVDRSFGILDLYREEKTQKLFICYSTHHLVGVPANNAHVLLRMYQFCIKCPPQAWLSNINFVNYLNHHLTTNI